MNILGRRVVLRALEEEDAPLLHAWANEPEIWQRLGGWHFPTSLAATRTWIAAQSASPADRRFAITLGGELLGTANLVEIDWKNRHAHHGMMIGPVARRGQGIGTDTIMAIMRHAFDELGFERLDSSIIEHNEPSRRAYCDRCGWVLEGRQRRWFHRQGRFWDRLIIGVTRDDYHALLERTRYWD
ncbi:GNAT family N-acetyltransferase [Roseomonas sp. SSH11]|uniref:GNAT family N-acetyltransferase n=1 Tax=Pararoseomonas baculiformis TaxID=2820812 RepID=A0ABS4AAU3_9PROT|nr:GNAT family protein [Pararoseomonas baculiformis]MBP0444122.1 GNAT family N-acetyltransferase [Pararoseomonas baculiformis]